MKKYVAPTKFLASRKTLAAQQTLLSLDRNIEVAKWRFATQGALCPSFFERLEFQAKRRASGPEEIRKTRSEFLTNW
jgi:hypothetical protein